MAVSVRSRLASLALGRDNTCCGGAAMRTAVGLLLQMSRAKFTLSLRKDGQLRYPALRLTMRRQRAGAADALVQRKTSEASGKAVALDLCLGLEIRNLVEVRVRFLTKE